MQGSHQRVNPPQGEKVNSMRKINWIVIHHSWSVDHPNVLDYWGIYDYHTKDQKMLDVGYQRVYDRVQGRPLCIKGRPEEIRGAHCLGYNQSSLGHCIIGNGDKVNFLDDVDLMNIVVKNVKADISQYDIPIDHVIAHWESFVILGQAKDKQDAWDKFKTCPGRLIDMEKFREMCKNA